MDAIEFGQSLTKFSNYQPTHFDAKGLGSAGQEEWRVLPVTITRDTGAYEESNFETAKKLLDDKDVEYKIHRFGHWGPGWFEIIVVEPTDAGLTVAGEIVSALEGYPVLDDEDFSEREHEANSEHWDNYGAEEVRDELVRIFGLREEADDLLREHGDEVLMGLWMNGTVEFSGEELYTRGLERLTRNDVAKLLRAARECRDNPTTTKE